MTLHILFALVVLASVCIIGWALVYIIVRFIVRIATEAVQWTERTRRRA